MKRNRSPRFVIFCEARPFRKLRICVTVPQRDRPICGRLRACDSRRMRRFGGLIAITLAACGGGGSRDHTAPTAAFVAYPSAGAAPLSVRFDATASRDDVGVAVYQWDFGDGHSARGAVVDHTYATKGAFLAALLATDAAGNQGRAQEIIEVTAAPDAVPPVASFTASASSGVAPLSVHFDASASSDDTGVTASEWDFGDSLSAEGALADHVFASAGAFTVTLTVRDAAGNAGRAQQSIAVTAPSVDTEAPRANFTATPLAGVAPLIVHLDASGSTDDVGVTRAQFDLGDGRTLDGAVQDAIYPVAGRFTITLTVWDASGKSASATQVATVEALPSYPDEHIFADAMDAPWQDWSGGWATSYSLSATSPVHAGAASVRFKPQSWQGLHFHSTSGFDVTGYDRLSFWLHGGGAGGQKLLVAAWASGALSSAIDLSPYLVGAASIPANAWVQALVPLAAIGAGAGKTLDGIIVQDGSGTSQPDVYLDDFTVYPELGGPAVAPCAPVQTPSGFVTRSGTSLMLGGAPFHARGANVYYLQSDLANAQQFGNAGLLQKARESLDVLVCLGMPVVRTWAFNERVASSDPASIQPSPGVFREAGLAALDQSVAEAKQRGLRVILTLVDNWNYYGGLPQYAAWAGKQHDDFFADAQMKSWWKAYAATLLSRVNTVTGVRYRDEPAILAWEIGNEFRCEACKGTARVHDAIAELAAYLRSLGATQLIADGGEGFDDHPGLWSLSNSYPVNGNEGASFSTLAGIPQLDLLSFHVYPSNYGLNADADAVAWFDGHQQIAAEGLKVAYAGEYGFSADDAARAAKYDAWLAHVPALGFVWQVLPEGVANNDGFGVYYPSDGVTLDVLAKWAR